MDPDKITQPELNTSQNYLFSITKNDEELEEGCGVYTVNVYMKSKLEGFNREYPINVGSFTMSDFGELFFKNLKSGIEGMVNHANLLNWAKGK